MQPATNAATMRPATPPLPVQDTLQILCTVSGLHGEPLLGGQPIYLYKITKFIEWVQPERAEGGKTHRLRGAWRTARVELEKHGGEPVAFWKIGVINMTDIKNIKRIVRQLKKLEHPERKQIMLDFIDKIQYRSIPNPLPRDIEHATHPKNSVKEGEDQETTSYNPTPVLPVTSTPLPSNHVSSFNPPFICSRVPFSAPPQDTLPSWAAAPIPQPQPSPTNTRHPNDTRQPTMLEQQQSKRPRLVHEQGSLQQRETIVQLQPAHTTQLPPERNERNERKDTLEFLEMISKIEMHADTKDMFLRRWMQQAPGVQV